MGVEDDTWLRKAQSIVADLFGGDPARAACADHGFAVEPIGGWHVLSRRGHAIGVLQRKGDELQFTRAGYAEPTFRSSNDHEMKSHIAEVIASVMRPFDRS